ncbi:PAS domain S-box protein [Ectobacillus sp. JY-23]|uniref:sensor domain-containing protein n=1 Tax=Ectobacillus sp. JY-23 TaxID=2933872 RepID=UPI001FF4F304|nr:PAS domain S-box protein [Ectobacillus sp. JY-23]UOY91128.1 PAS domain S-box protein [Ectobacillus sp. JY-23]
MSYLQEILFVLLGIWCVYIWRQHSRKQTQRSRSEQQYYEMMEMNTDPIAFQVGQTIVYVNEATVQLLGATSKNELLGKNVFELISPSQWKLAWKNFRDQNNRGYVRFFETEMIRLNGERIMTEIVCQEAIYQDMYGMRFIIRDVTQKRETERKMLEAKEKLEAFFTNSADPMYIMDLDRKILQVNPAFEELFEMSEKELYGKKFAGKLLLAEEERISYVKRATSGHVVRDVETAVVRKDGTHVPVSLTLSPIRDEAGKVVMLSGVMRDMTVKQQYEQALRESEYRYRIIAEHSNDYILTVSKELVTTYASPAIRTVLGYAPEEVVQSHFYHGIHQEDLARVQNGIASVLHAHTPTILEYRVQAKEKEWVWIEARFIPIPEFDHIVVSTKDIRERKQYEAQLKELAFFDPLTGIANRRAFEERLHYFLERGQPFALCYLDFDNFKQINDVFSHEGGDTFLIEVGRRLNSVVRTSDLPARLGGDEFVLLIPKITKEGMTNIANRIVEAFQQPFQYKNQHIIATVSMGIALYPYDGTDAETLMRRADEALYQVKEKGRNDFQFSKI